MSLARDAAAGQVDAFEELYRRHAPTAWGVAQAIVRNTEDAADAVAEAFTNVFRVLPEATRDGQEVRFRPYLLAATRHAAIDIVRRTSRVRPTDDLDQCGGSPPVVARSGQPADEVLAREDLALVAQAFAQLPERWRSALWLIDVERLSTREAGSILGVEANNAAQLATRARSRLREHYLQAHVPNHIQPLCQDVVACLGSYLAGTASRARRAMVDRHVAECGECAERLTHVEDLGITLRRSLLPLPLLLHQRVRGSVSRVIGPRPSLLDGGAAQVASSPTALPLDTVSALVQQLSAASPIFERVIAGASAAALVVGVLSLAVKSQGDRAGPTDRTPVAAASPAPPRSATAGDAGATMTPASSGHAAGPGAVGAAVMNPSAELTGEAGGSPVPGLPALASPDLTSAVPGLPLPARPTGPPPLSSPLDGVERVAGAAMPNLAATSGGLVRLNPASPPAAADPLPAVPTAPAQLLGPSLRGAGLSGANLDGGALSGVDLTGTDLTHATLSRADLSRAQLPQANLADANLTNAVASGANLAGANLTNVVATGANLAGADLTGAVLSGADLRSADLRNADLGGAVLAGADLTGAALAGADLAGADLGGQRLEGLTGPAAAGAVTTGPGLLATVAEGSGALPGGATAAVPLPAVPAGSGAPAAATSAVPPAPLSAVGPVVGAVGASPPPGAAAAPAATLPAPVGSTVGSVADTPLPPPVVGSGPGVGTGGSLLEAPLGGATVPTS